MFIHKIHSTYKIISSFLKNEGDTLIFQTSNFIKYMKDYGISIDPSDIHQENPDEILLSFDSYAFDGSVSPDTLKKLDVELKKITHVDFVYIDTAKYQMRLEFDKPIEL